MKTTLLITTMLLATVPTHAQTITVAPASGAGGSSSELVVRWDGAPPQPALGIQVRLRFPAFITVDADRCEVNPAIARPDSGFSFHPDPDNELRAVLLSFDASVFDPLPPDAELFRCPMHIAAWAPEGRFALACRWPVAALAPADAYLERPLACVPGWFEVPPPPTCLGIDDAVRAVGDALNGCDG